MNTRTTLIIFGVVFSLGLFAIVLLPFLLGKGPVSPKTEKPEEAQAAADQGVFRSTDGGRTWDQKSAVAEGGSIASFKVNRLMLDPADPATLWLATDGSGLFVSRDRGDLWQRVADETGLFETTSNVLAIAVHPQNREEWYAAVFQKNRGRVLRTADGGRTFRAIYFTPLERFGVFDLHYDRTRGTILIATGQGGLIESADRGLTWRVVRWFADGLLEILVNPVSPQMRFAVSSRGKIFRSRDFGETWADASSSLREFPGAEENQRWVIDRLGNLWLGSRHGLLRSSDDAETLDAPPLIIPPEALPVLAIAVHPGNPSRIAVSADSQLYQSENGGETWAILPSPAPLGKRVTHLMFDPEQQETLYAVVQP